MFRLHNAKTFSYLLGIWFRDMLNLLKNIMFIFFFGDLCANVRSRFFLETITSIEWSCYFPCKFTGLLVIIPSLLYTNFTPSCFILSAHDVSICEFKHISDKLYYTIQRFLWHGILLYI